VGCMRGTEGESAVEVAKWEGVLDRLCRLDETDVDALDSGIPGLSALAAPVVDAYNHDEFVTATIDCRFARRTGRIREGGRSEDGGHRT